MTSLRLNILFSLVIGSSLVVDEANSKLLSSLLKKNKFNCPTSGAFFMPRLPSLSSLLCPPGYPSWSTSYPYSNGYLDGYNMYPQIGGAYTTSSYPYGNSYWSGNNEWSYTPTSWYGRSSKPYTNDKQKERNYYSNSFNQQRSHQQSQLFADSDSGNLPSTQPFHQGSRLTSMRDKFSSMNLRKN